jgi:hypothetical protein
MTLLDVANSINPFNANKAYFGKQGCACGCGGNYHHTYHMVSRAITTIRNHIKRNGDRNVEFIRGFDNELILSLERERTAVRVYFSSPTPVDTTLFTS